MTKTPMTPAPAVPAVTMTSLEEWRARARAETAALRERCRAELRALGASRVEAEYNGYADQGNVDEVRYAPDGVAVGAALNGALLELMWRLAGGTNPGFETGDGGRGEIEWDLGEDHITVRHWACFVDEIFSEHGGV